MTVFDTGMHARTVASALVAGRDRSSARPRSQGALPAVFGRVWPHGPGHLLRHPFPGAGHVGGAARRAHHVLPRRVQHDDGAHSLGASSASAVRSAWALAGSLGRAAHLAATCASVGDGWSGPRNPTARSTTRSAVSVGADTHALQHPAADTGTRGTVQVKRSAYRSLWRPSARPVSRAAATWRGVTARSWIRGPNPRVPRPVRPAACLTRLVTLCARTADDRGQIQATTEHDEAIVYADLGALARAHARTQSAVPARSCAVSGADH